MSQTDTKCHWHLPADSKRTLPHHYAILPFTYTNTHAHAFTPKVFAAYHVFSDQLTLAGDRKPATKTEICGSQQRNQDCSLRAGNGKFRPLHIPVHLASGSTFKKNRKHARKCACGQRERRWRRIRIYASNLSICLLHMLLPSQTRAYASTRTTGFFVFWNSCCQHRRPAAPLRTISLTDIKYDINVFVLAGFQWLQPGLSCMFCYQVNYFP